MGGIEKQLNLAALVLSNWNDYAHVYLKAYSQYHCFKLIHVFKETANTWADMQK